MGSSTQNDRQRFNRPAATLAICLLSSRVGAWLITALLIQMSCAASSALAQDTAKRHDPRVPLLSLSETWEHLPEPEEGGGGELPLWARALAVTLPRTTAAMLELDWVHRANSPIDPKLRGMMRWTVARANRCNYTEETAAADLRGIGFDPRQLSKPDAQSSNLSDAERRAIAFAHKLTVAADTVTDDEVVELVESYGDKTVVAMVLLIAHGNFQDRLFLSLGLDAEPNGPLPPIAVRFAKESQKELVVPDRKVPVNATAADTNRQSRIDDAEWLSKDFSALQTRLDAQRDRSGRIRVPSWEDVQDLLPVRRKDPLRIKWSLVCIGYQPELALGWSACTRAFGQEAKQDRVFEETLFWVITRTIDCFY